MVTFYFKLFIYLSPFSVPAPVCPTPPISSGGVITVHWSYTHTGGLELTQVIMTAHRDVQTNIQVDVPNGNLTDPSQTYLNISTFTTGFSYTFQVTTYNKLGSSTAQCDPVIHLIGMSAGGHISWFVLSFFLSLSTVDSCHFLQVSLMSLKSQLAHQILLVALLSSFAHQHPVECRLRCFYSLSTSHRHPTAWRVPVH